LNRRKQGFSLPLIHWMRHELKDELMSILLEPRTLQRGYFEAESIRSVLDDHFRRRRDHAGVLWMLLIFELWHRNFLEREVSREPALAAARLRQSTGSQSPTLVTKESARP
jgi:asparagine synthetase B (glutamine-hydrolysing)